MKGLLIAICIVCTVNGDTLRLSKISGMTFSKTSLDASDVSNFLLELLGLKVNPKFPNVILEDPFGYANVLMLFEDGGSLGCLPFSVFLKTKETVDWDGVEKVVLNETRGKKAIFYESPEKPLKGQKNELVKVNLVAQQKELEQIRTRISGVSNSKTVIWIKTIKSQDVTKQYCSIIQDFMKEASAKVLVGLISKDPVPTHHKRTLLQTDEDVPPVATKGKSTFGTSRDFPVVFTIVVVVLLIFFLSVLAISCGVAKMDPGRDSIIYRMTSQRMKKDQ